MPFGTHLVESRSLMEIKRYQNKYCFKKRSVAEHMWSVAKIAEGLAIWESKKFGNKVDMAKVLQKAINHDMIEQCTGDILGPTKKKTQAMREAMEEIEEIAFREDIESHLPKSWRNQFKSYILNPKTDDVEGQIIRAADIIDTMIESIEEIKLGNDIFRAVLIDSSESLIKVDLDSVRYFIKYAILDFDIDIKEFFGKELFSFRETLHFDPAVFEACKDIREE
ncbi:YfbR-like 5'-deoxynucleotidase [Spirochaeta isovalerica]|uniref:5'-deoxynucleotidase YfbR-like HD superfamily hydrolase n=1 Tax=Spirochaeta isovalerica TaxID=150 RepID=A0A841R6D9_9SPIO|nr:YfbR-like 5'-deoxynucleotidase [Spirochaeta isovalerica]MBB6479406.1 5'-deoxynucleotidase YfbR-like HD superfamily hydrolase [Spirochaeta isovalerica]